ncbi:uncharacterized protein LOC135955408 [Calliphora vicina]|uniref:uncharacterized protein LOC135955408 n=1 Tax=Calliphora vicina TaxID=7373 RepID=UPI00325BEA19
MGSNVTANDCSRTWKTLRNTNRLIGNRTELRIQEAKLNGSYNPNNDYGSDWTYLEHMKFVSDNKKTPVNYNKSDLEMSNAMDKRKLIAEVRKRPALWDINAEEHKSIKALQTAWKDVAVAIGSNVTANDCSRTWKIVRNTYLVIVKRIELYVQEAKRNGLYNPNNEYGSDWPYLEDMKFVNDIKKLPVNDNKSELEMSNNIDKFKLIAEIRKRPALWDIKSEEHRSCLSVPEVWKDLAVSVGSDVEKCQRNWINLCRSYRSSVKHIESRIKEDKLNGSYDPNNDYSSKWAYFEAFQFMKDHTTHWIKLRTSADKLKLIAEVRYRPELWCKSKEYIPRFALQKSWEYLARDMGADVDDCKRNWKILLSAQRTEVKKLELRIKEDKLKGSYNPNNEYRSNWIYYEHMKFCYDIKNPSLMELGNTSVNDNNSDDNDLNQVSELENMDNYKMEPELDLDTEVYIPDDEDDDTDSQMYSIEFVSEPNSPQNQESADDKPSSTGGNCTKPFFDQANLLEDIKKEEHNLTKSANAEPGLDLDTEVYIPDDEDCDSNSQMSGMEFLSEQNSPQNQESADDKPSSTGGNCYKRTYDQSNFLEDLEKEEHNLSKSTKVELGLDLDTEVYIPDDEDCDTDSQMSGMEFLSEPNSPQNQESADDKPSSTGGNCTKRTYDQANFLEDLEKEEHNLTKSSRLGITRSNSMINVGDSDFNFLVSLLPQMKMINNLQNFKFREKMNNVMFNIMSASSSRNVKSNNKS